MQAYLTEQHLCLVMEFPEGDDLHAYMVEKGSLIESLARRLFQQVPALLPKFLHRTMNCVDARLACVNKDISHFCEL